MNVLDLRHVALFQNKDDSTATEVEQSRPTFALFTFCKSWERNWRSIWVILLCQS